MDFAEYNDVVKAWVKEVLNNRGVNAERTLKCCNDIEQYAMQTVDAKLLGFSYYYSGETYYVLNDGEQLFKYITRAITYLDQSEQWELVAKAYNIMAITSYNRGNAPIAMDYYLTGLNYCKKYGIYNTESMINLNLGTLYMNCGQYDEAQHYFERTYSYFRDNKEQDNYLTCMTCVYANLGKCYVLRDMSEKAQEYCDKLDKECAAHLEHTELLYVLCFKSLYYHKTGRITRRDESIEMVHERINEDLAIMDIFDDFYDFCLLLLELKRDDVLWDILRILEELAKRAKIINLQRKIIALKLKYYRANRDNAGYLQAAGLYYELTEVMEHENQYMIMNMLNVRSSLERANERRRKVEAVNERLLVKSETDQLTGLANRYKLNDYSETIFERCREDGRKLAVEILDIDYFKQYNDNYGHQAGDDCIVAIANRLIQLQNDHIFCARYGGDEFIIIYEGMQEEEVLKKAEMLRNSIMDLQIEHLYSKALPTVTITQGICLDIPVSVNKNWDFLHMADMMLYRAKEKNRNNICIGSLNEEHAEIKY